MIPHCRGGSAVSEMPIGKAPKDKKGGKKEKKASNVRHSNTVCSMVIAHSSSAFQVDVAKALAHKFEPATFSYTDKEVILYALGVGTMNCHASWHVTAPAF